MKDKKRFKLERKIVEEVYETLKSYLTRSKHLIAFIEQENTAEQYTSNMLILYCNSILNYMFELDKLLLEDGSHYLVTADLVDKLNKHKKVLVELEEQFNNNTRYSLKVH
jgi:hypothetical protein